MSCAQSDCCLVGDKKVAREVQALFPHEETS